MITVELFCGPMDGHRLDVPGPLPTGIVHQGRQYLDTGMTCEDGTPVYRYIRTLHPREKEAPL